MASVRITKVKEKQYIQVVDYYTDPRTTTDKPLHRLRVLKSFGSNSWVHLLQAQHFVADYDLLVKFLESTIFPTGDIRRLFLIASEQFGHTLGADLIEQICIKAHEVI